MAAPTNFSILFLLLLASSFNVQAREVRESHFFNKAVRENNVDEPEAVDKQLPSPKQEEPTTFTPQSQNGYGLYAHDSNQDPPTTATNYNVQQYNGQDEFRSSKFPNQYYNDERNYEHENPTSTFYPTTQYVDRPQGMSDTRFLENGRYFYDINAEKERERNGFEFMKGDNNEGYRSNRGGNSDGYGFSKRVDPMNRYNHHHYGGYYGSNENAYEKYEP